MFPFVLFAVLLQDAPMVWRAVEDLRIGAMDGPTALTAVSDIVTSLDETFVFVAQPREQVIRKYDARSGSLLDVLGRSGQGPGEFRGIHRLGLRGDTLWAADLIQGRLVAFSTGGELLGTWTVRSRDEAGVSAVLPAADGTYWGESLFRIAPGINVRPLLLMDSLGHTLVPVVEQWLEVKAIVALDRAHTFMQPLANLEHLRAYAPDGSALVYLHPSDREGGDRALFTLVKIAANGDTLLTTRALGQGRPLPAAVRDSIYEAFAVAFGGTVARGRRLAQRHVDVPDPAPVVANVRLDTTGRIWLKRVAWDEPELNWFVVSDGGRILARLKIPDHVHVFHVTTTHIWGVEHDELDIPYVVRFRIDRGPD